MITADTLAQALLDAVRAQHFEQTPDSLQHGGPVPERPSLDLAVACFPPGRPPVAANVLFSRELPEGFIARPAGGFGAIENVGFHADLRDAAGTSIGWQPGARWEALAFPAWFGRGPRFVAPYPASLLKVMVAVGIGRLVDQDRSAWALPWAWGGQTRAIADWLWDMITVSSNDATSALVAHLHARGAIRRVGGVEVHNELHELFRAEGLPGLQIANTQPDGGWGNGSGAGVGQIQMTAWDTLRLMWRLDADAPPAPWLPAGAPPLLSDASRAVLRRALDGQQLGEILSSTALSPTLPGWVAGIPGAGVRYAHKTGTTENYASDAGIVQAEGGLHYLIAVTTNLGSRYRPHDDCATTWKLPALGGAVHAWLAAHA